MELYKLRYNLYNYLIHNTTNYESNTANKNIWFYGLISYYTFFTFMLILNYNNINLSTIIFIIIGIFFLYYCYLLDIALTNIIENPNFKDYVSLYTLLNAIFIESYKSNNINYLIHDIIKSDTDLSLLTILNEKYTVANANLIEISNSAGNTYVTIGNGETTEILTQAKQLKPSLLKNIIDTNYVYLEFKTGTYTLDIINNNLTFDILLIGGGGGGGSRHGGGGGAGAFIYLTNQNLKAGSYSITIGDGGTGGIGSGDNGVNGTDTVISINSSNIYLAKGGGGGSYYNNGVGVAGGSSGGSSGGRQSYSSVVVTNNIPSGTYGNIGGKGSIGTSDYWAGGGGGGADGVGGDAIQVASGTRFSGTGGIGRQIDITGTLTYYAGGGGGGLNSNYEPASGGLGGGGTGGNNISPTVNSNQNGLANTGSGGGGGGWGSDSGGGGNGGSGIVIIRFKNQDMLIKQNTTTITLNKGNEIKFIKKTVTSIGIRNLLLIIVFYNDEHYFINYLINNYYKFDKIIYKLNTSTIINIQGDYYLIDIDELNKKTKPELYRLLVEYLRFKNKISATQKITEKTSLSTLLTIDGNTNTYLNKYYDTLTTINTVIQNNDNISMDDMSTYIDELVKNKDVLKYIDVYSEAYDYLKKYIYIKYDETNEIYKYISDNYEANKDNKVSILKDNLEIVGDVIIKITVKDAIIDYIIDIKTINIYLNDKTKNTSHVNSYISKIYEYLIAYLNKTYDLQITNFDALYKENKNIDLIVKAKVDLFIYLFNIIIAIVIIILTVVMHVFYIQLYNPIKLFNL